MTFTQLRTFALVAELGSLRAAAAALGVSEPAVSSAVAALRADLGDPSSGAPAPGSASPRADGRWPRAPGSSSGWPTAPGAR
ncbi:LysR family transcriptional regulator [Blastococcus brunescens]|uniref:LysR family transcriptional regulator n=1 Tax=Blastococcus brunescens TaxID=1564165 RepID=A0ABZ1AV00_9ACTN|nr:LysR family transcriptional regulator [Blastococcus sp. BMG 8361]WRL62377.1 LysR family transcriptional regulator [Blastococcus sp. BMG 8361]